MRLEGGQRALSSTAAIEIRLMYECGIPDISLRHRTWKLSSLTHSCFRSHDARSAHTNFVCTQGTKICNCRCMDRVE
eukprot:4202529-Pyramimonas_sp.AAC.1